MAKSNYVPRAVREAFAKADRILDRIPKSKLVQADVYVETIDSTFEDAPSPYLKGQRTVIHYPGWIGPRTTVLYKEPNPGRIEWPGEDNDIAHQIEKRTQARIDALTNA